MEGLIGITCCQCGVYFCVLEGLAKLLDETQRAFYCPNGHPQAYTGESEAEKLAEARRQLAIAKAQIARLRKAQENA